MPSNRESLSPKCIFLIRIMQNFKYQIILFNEHYSRNIFIGILANIISLTEHHSLSSIHRRVFGSLKTNQTQNEISNTLVRILSSRTSRPQNFRFGFFKKLKFCLKLHSKRLVLLMFRFLNLPEKGR